MAFHLNATYGYLIPIAKGSDVSLYWPLRAGAGFLVGEPGFAYFDARADVVGIALQIGQVMLDFHAPSFRFAWTPESYNNMGDMVMHWYAGVSGSYIF